MPRLPRQMRQKLQHTLVYPEEAGLDLILHMKANCDTHKTFYRVGNSNRRRVFDGFFETVLHRSF